MKTVYLYDKDTGEYTGIYEAQESPLEKGQYIVPTYTTEVQPPALTEGKYQKWIGNSWLLAEDTRGVWYKPDGTSVEVEELVESINPTWSRTPIERELTLPEQFELVRQALQGEIDRRARNLGFSSGDALMLYAGKDNPFRALADPFFNWEASVWFEAGAYRQQVLAGNYPMISPEQAVAEMPRLQI